MKKKVLSALVMATVAIGAYAQGYAGTTFNDRIGHGQDSLDVINNFSLYREEFKNQNYKDAYDAWKVVMEKAPLAERNRCSKETGNLQHLDEYARHAYQVARRPQLFRYQGHHNDKG